MAQDLVILSQFTSTIRLYSIAACKDSTRQILSYCRARGMKVFLGLWLSRDLTANEQASESESAAAVRHALITCCCACSLALRATS